MTDGFDASGISSYRHKKGCRIRQPFTEVNAYDVRMHKK